jgi:hypothetical protein
MMIKSLSNVDSQLRQESTISSRFYKDLPRVFWFGESNLRWQGDVESGDATDYTGESEGSFCYRFSLASHSI